MRKVLRIAAPLVLAVVLGQAALALAPDWIASDFSSGTDGWEIRGAGVGPVWESYEGNPPGSISAAGEGGVSSGPGWYFHAPARFCGNRSTFYGRTLRYDLKVRDSDRGAKDDVLLRGGGITLVYDDKSVPMPMWSARFIRLSIDGGWQKRVGSMRTEASRADFETVLRSLADLEIRGGSSNESSTFLDNVSLNAPMWASAAYASPWLLLVGGAFGVIALICLRRRA